MEQLSLSFASERTCVHVCVRYLSSPQEQVKWFNMLLSLTHLPACQVRIVRRVKSHMRSPQRAGTSRVFFFFLSGFSCPRFACQLPHCVAFQVWTRYTPHSPFSLSCYWLERQQWRLHTTCMHAERWSPFIVRTGGSGHRWRLGQTALFDQSCSPAQGKQGTVPHIFAWCLTKCTVVYLVELMVAGG